MAPTRQTVLAITMISLTLGMMPLAAGFQLDTTVIANQNLARATYTSGQIIYMEYPDDGALKSLLEGVSDEVRFTADKNTPGVNEMIARINDALVKERRSPATVEGLTVEYKALLKGENGQATLEHYVKLKANITNIVIQPGTYTEPDLIDLNWRGFSVDGPVVIETQEYGKVDINQPSGYFAVRQPGVLNMFDKTDASKILSLSALDYLEFVDLPMVRWHKLTNPIGSQIQGKEIGFKEEGGYKAVTIYSAGESSLREGIHEAKTEKVEVTVDGVDYIVRSTSPASSATMEILGWSKTSIDESNGDESSRVFFEAPEGEGGESPTGSFPVMVIAALGGLMGVIAGFVIWRANKKH